MYTNIRSVRNPHVQELTLILKINVHCDVKHIMTSSIRKIKKMLVLKISTYIITARPVGLGEILAIMSFSTFKPAVILYFLPLSSSLCGLGY